MSLLHFASVSIHVLSAILWLGGMFFLALIGAPVLRTVEPPALRVRLFQLLGLRFRNWAWWLIAVLVVTGTANLHFRGLLDWNLLASAGFWATPLGRALGWKLAAVTAMLVFSAVHDFVVGPAAGRAAPGSETAVRARRQASLLARVNALAGVVVVLAAVRLARGG